MTGERNLNVSPGQPGPGAGLPDAGEVKRFAVEALRALKSAQEQLGRDAEELQLENDRIETDRQQLVRQQEELAERREDFEVDLVNLKEMAAELGQQRESIESQFSGQKEALESQQLELERRKQELEERSRQIEARDAELGELRETLLAMQAQLADDQKEVAAQREALLRQLGDSDQSGPMREGRQNVQNPPAQANVPQKHHPKPAAAAAADQFRKLRRDAKRKAIGV